MSHESDRLSDNQTEAEKSNSEDFQPDSGFVASSAATDKWEGEDEEDGVKDSWEDEDKAENADASGDSSSDVKAYQKKKKKPLAERIAERELAEKLAKEEEEAKKAKKPLSAEEKLAEKLRIQKIQKDADLKVARETFGISASGLDSFQPETQEEFVKFSEALTEKILTFQPSPCFSGFLEKLFTDLALSLETEDVKKFGGLLNNIYHEKNRLSKQEQDAKKKKKKSKATIRVGKSDDLDDLVAAAASPGNYGYDDDYI
ncbi:eukaryotic translation initiation factor 3 subunit J-A-like [Liolophura sinensis]|uniref:eukaryotic translation initiation factor 3 subunit J-A-like n=1 Tax=Liolophura sinensis TaxID=3198878 RepID=UPI0031588AC9